MVSDKDFAAFGNKIHAMAADANIGVYSKMILNQLDVFFSLATAENLVFRYSLLNEVERERGMELINFLQEMEVPFAFNNEGKGVGAVILKENNPNLPHFVGFLQMLIGKHGKKYQQVISYMERKDYDQAEKEAKSLVESIEYRKKASRTFYLGQLLLFVGTVILIRFLIKTWF